MKNTNPSAPTRTLPTLKTRFITRAAVLLCVLVGSVQPSRALDLSAIAEDNATAFKEAVQAEGGTLGGEPYVSSAAGPDGQMQRVIVFPTPDCFVEIPVNPPGNLWTMTGSIFVERWGFEILGGAVFGVLFGPNDYVLALGLGKWSKLKALFLQSGLTELISEQSLSEAGVPASDAWQEISLALDGNAFRLRIGSEFETEGAVEEDGRAALTRRKNLVMRLGSFQGKATLPTLVETP